MNVNLSHPTGACTAKLQITGSKSETNRLLLLQALFPGFSIANTSSSDDSEVMKKALSSTSDLIDVNHAGTAMRFLSAYFSLAEGREVLLTGSQRMQERPIKVLVEALRALGATISYEKEEGYPPLRIKGKKLKGGTVQLPADISSQYISALLLIGPVLEAGLKLELVGKITSVPYIEMTCSLLKRIGADPQFEGQIITVNPLKKPVLTQQIVESDWSSASYFFSMLSLSDSGTIHLKSYRENSLQGDRVLMEIYEQLGISASLGNQVLKLKKVAVEVPEILQWNLAKAPDIAQTIAVSCLGLGIGCRLEGLHTLKIKETDRLQALYNELTKLGASVKITADSLILDPCSNLNSNCSIPTYNDHRMAMAFAPLALKVPIVIEDAQVVSKSYPTFWEDLKQLNFQITRR
jgi:3-phosphoshikimate 1-carboxyvinyltransferase